MREIKFRVWDGERMIRWSNIRRTPYYLVLQLDGQLVDHAYDRDYEHDFPIMQYTGRKDKNGLTEVYEGDILDGDGQIVGNIYESPEILERPAHIQVAEMGTPSWRDTEAALIERGCRYAERHDFSHGVR